MINNAIPNHTERMDDYMSEVLFFVITFLVLEASCQAYGVLGMFIAFFIIALFMWLCFKAI